MRWTAILSAVVLLAGVLLVMRGRLSYAGADGPATQPGRREVSPELAAKLKPDANNKVTLTDAEWKQVLTDDQYHVLRDKGTERPFANAYADNHAEGTYLCAACDQVLYDANTKFESGTGWPSFYQPIDDKAVARSTDRDLGYERDEIHCSRCGGHLGHVFPDGPKPTGLRYCMNSAAMKFVPR